MQLGVHSATGLGRLGLMLLVASVTADARSENIWPGFRGHGNSHAAGKQLPLCWEL